jgi:L-alanine-DL-glutamate epimerase-like enolase superfamily enzyme
VRLSSLHLVEFGGALSAKLSNANTAWTSRAGILLCLSNDAGLCGLGEASPLPNYSPDTLDQCRAVLSWLSARLEQIDTASLAAGLWRAALSPLGGALSAVPSARFALETALLDLLGQDQQKPLWSLLRRGFAHSGPHLANAPDEAAERRRRRVPLHALLSDPTAPKLREEAARAFSAGYRACKLKIGTPGRFAEELAGLRLLRREFPGLSMRLDANGAWGLSEAREKLAQLAELSPEFVEQPTAPELLPTLGRCAVSWAADESLQDETASALLLRDENCAVLVYKPGVLGLARCLDLTQSLRAPSPGYLVTHLFDGPVGLSAARELAFALQPDAESLSAENEPHERAQLVAKGHSEKMGEVARSGTGSLLACGLDEHPGLSAWPSVQLPHLTSGGFIEENRAPGLGFSAKSRAMLQSLTQAR